MSSREGRWDRERGSASHTTRSLLQTPVSTRPHASTHQIPQPHTPSQTPLHNHRTQITVIPITAHHRTNAPGTPHTTVKTSLTHPEIAKTAIQQTNQPTPGLTLSSNTHIKLAALVIEAHIASLAKTESYGTILSKSLKSNFDNDISFPHRDSQQIFNLCVNPTAHSERALPATTPTTTEITSTHIETDTDHSATDSNDSQEKTLTTLHSMHGEHGHNRKNTIKRKKTIPPIPGRTVTSTALETQR
ncbi:hypothetical protein FHG87_000385 [Trinorchestia longiramus]|nr:hypothetical protein FHG87_000385 [Trinorchestia longiramus]